MIEQEGTLEKIKRYDDERAGFPAEHWIVLALGVGAWAATRRSPSLVVKTLGALAGTLLVARRWAPWPAPCWWHGPRAGARA